MPVFAEFAQAGQKAPQKAPPKEETQNDDQKGTDDDVKEEVDRRCHARQDRLNGMERNETERKGAYLGT